MSFRSSRDIRSFPLRPARASAFPSGRGEFRKSLVLGSLLAAVGLVASCGGGSASESEPSKSSSASSSATGKTASPGFQAPSAMPAGKGSGKTDGEFPRTVAHFQGETTIGVAPRRVVVISTGQADALLTLGIVPVGSAAPDGRETIPQYLKDSHPEKKAELEAVAYVGSRTAPTVEEIGKLHPDLILVNDAGKDDSKALYDSLTAVAPTVVTEGTGVNWKSDFLLLADAVGKKDAAQTWLDSYRKEAKEAGRKVKGDPKVSFLRRDGDRIRVFGRSSFAGSIADDMGLARPKAQTFTDDTSLDLSSEELDKADGTWIFYGVKGGRADELTSLPLWKTLEAVSKERAVQVEDDPFYLNAGPTAAKTVLDKLSGTLAG